MGDTILIFTRTNNALHRSNASSNFKSLKKISFLHLEASDFTNSSIAFKKQIHTVALALSKFASISAPGISRVCVDISVKVGAAKKIWPAFMFILSI